MRVRSNIAALYGLQIANYAAPLITTPYLARVLGVEQFGVLGIAASVIAYLTIISDWGFSYTATQRVAQNAADPATLREIFWDTFTARMALGAICVVVLLATALLTASTKNFVPVLLGSSVTFVTSLFGVGWFLQGLEKLGSLALLSVAGRLLSLPLTFWLVHTPADAALAAAIPGVTGVAATVLGYIVASRAVPFFPARFDCAGAWRQIRDGWQMFVSTGAISLYTTSNIVVLGALTGAVNAGYLNGAERIRRAAQAASGPLSAAMFPRINNLMAYEPTRVTAAMKKLLLWQGGLSFLLSVAMFVSAPFVTVTFLGADFAPAIPIVQWLSATPFLVGLSNVLGVNIMLPLGMRSHLLAITLIAGPVNLALLTILSLRYGAVGAAMSIVAAELFVTISFGLVILFSRQELRRRVLASAKPKEI